jgi:cell wall-associated NlpC family hydrolase
VLFLVFIAVIGAPDARHTNVAFVEHARKLLGVPYVLGGRMRRTAPGVDCQGVLFYAAQAVSSCGWRSFSVFPTVAVQSGELGRPVDGLAPVATDELDTASLQIGDLLFLVSPVQNPREEAIAQLRRRPVWVLHTGVYSGGGNWIVGDHYAGRVVETPFVPYLREHSDIYSGVYVLRMDRGPQPKSCRKHKPMVLPTLQ